MTRQIKFRVWTGSTMEENVLVGKLGAFYAAKDSSNTASAVTTLYPKNIHVMQFTGLLDKNKKEIYEGDILDSSEKIPMIFEVYYQDGGFRYGTRDRSVYISFSGHNWLEKILKRFHVIGNIHQNPELLEVKN